MQKIILLLFVMCLMLSASLNLAQAKQSDSKTLTREDVVEAETDVDQGLKNFGYISGLAHGCVASSQQEELESEVIDINAEISRALGSDRAFLFAASFGYGTNMKLNKPECEEALAGFEQRLARFYEQIGGRK